MSTKSKILLQSNAQTIELWNNQLNLQVSLASSADLTFLFNLPGWAGAKRVLEVGCGNGSFLSLLAKNFSEKQFVGVDINKDFLAKAASASAPNLKFYARDIFALSEARDGQFDVVIARLVVQHLPSVSNFLKAMHAMLRPGGLLIVYDAHDSRRMFYPPMPNLDSFFQKLKEGQASNGGNREALQIVEREHVQFGYQLAAKQDILHSSTVPRNKKLLVQMLRNLSELVRLTSTMRFSYSDLEHELLRWFAEPNSYGQIALRALVLSKK